MACASKFEILLQCSFTLYLLLGSHDGTAAFLMIRSVFCLSPAGDTPSSARLFDAIVSGCLPVIISDELELPFEGILDYRKVCTILRLTYLLKSFFDLLALTLEQ